MKGKITLLLHWLFYAGLIYTAFNPNHGYLNYLENCKYVYLIIYIPIGIIVGILTAVMYGMKDQVQEKAQETYDGFSDEKKEEAMKNIPKFGNTFLYRISSIITNFTNFVVFIVLGDMFLGTVMLINTLIGFALIKVVKQFGAGIKL